MQRRTPDTLVRSAPASLGGGWCAWLFAAACWAMLVCPARAQPAGDADALFERGLNEMQAGDYASACPRLAESYRLDPLPGALFTLAECEAAWTKLASALEHYQRFLEMLPALPPARRARFAERRRIALEKIAALSATTPELSIEVSPAAPPELSIERDGVLLEPTLYGVATKIDPGSYVLTATLAGRRLWTRSVELAPSARVRVEVPWPLQEPAALALPQVPPARTRWPLRRFTYLSAGAGAAGLLAGAVAGGLALSKKHVIERHCAGSACDARGLRAVDAGQRAALVSNLGFGLGLAGAAATTTLWLLERRGRSERPVARRGLWPAPLAARAGAGLALEGRF